QSGNNGAHPATASYSRRLVLCSPAVTHECWVAALGRARSLIHFSNSPSRSRGALLRPGFASLLHSPRTRGGRSAEKRSGACEAPVGRAVSRHARRLARRLASHSASRRA